MNEINVANAKTVHRKSCKEMRKKVGVQKVFKKHKVKLKRDKKFGRQIIGSNGSFISKADIVNRHCKIIMIAIRF